MTVAVLAIAAVLAAEPAGGYPPAFTPGEETVFDIHYLNLPAGEGRISVGRAEGAIWPLIFQAKTAGVAGVVDIREHLVSYWDADLQLSRGWDLRAVELGDYHEDRSRIDRERRELRWEVRRNGVSTVRTFSVRPDAHDLTSAFMWLRTQRLAPGDRLEVPIASGRRQFMMIASVSQGEEVRTPAGTFRTVRLKVHTELGGPFATKRETTLWVSDDPRHVLVRVSADLALGSIVATVRSYRPGS